MIKQIAKEIKEQFKYTILHPVEAIMVFGVLIVPSILVGIVDKIF